MLSGSLNGFSTVPTLNNYTERYGDVDDLVIPHADDVILKSRLTLDEQNVEAFLTVKKLYWIITYVSAASRKQKKATHSVFISNLITIDYEQGCNGKSKSEEIELLPTRYFSIHYAKKSRANKLKYQQLIFQCADGEVCKLWINKVNELKIGFSRPAKLLVFINPVGGKREAEKVYSTKVAPLFDVGKIDVKKIVTERRNHAKEYLQSEDVSAYDGVVAVGGDGMFSEVMNGVLRFTDGEHHVLKSQTGKIITLGIIPAGSTDTVVYCTTGGNDPVTAALQIILGDELAMDVCSVWNENKLLKYSISLMAYGYFGDIIKESETMRWVGVRRYDFAGIKRFMVNKSYEGEVTFLGRKEQYENEQQQCKQGCKRCSTFIEETDHDQTKENNWKTITGRFISVLGANISCRCAKSLTGISPHAHIGDGHVYLVLVRKTTRARHLHHLIKISDRTTQQFDFNFIEVYRVKEFRFKPLSKHSRQRHSVYDESYDTTATDYEPNTTIDSVTTEDVCGDHSRLDSSLDTSVWNIDGEIIEHPELQFMVHRQLIRIFARGIEDL